MRVPDGWKGREVPTLPIPHPPQGEGVCWSIQSDVRMLLMEMLCFNSYNMHRVRNVVSVVLAYSSTSGGRVSVDPV